MEIYIDADACPVVKIIEKITQERKIKSIILCDMNHYMQSEYSEVITVSPGPDAVDFKILNMCKPGDIVVTQDYGLASLVLSKKAYAIHQSGMWYDDSNIDKLLFQRYVNKTERKKHPRNNRGMKIKKRTQEDDITFENSLIKMIEYIQKKES